MLYKYSWLSDFMHVKFWYVWELLDMNTRMSGDISTEFLLLSTQSKWSAATERKGFSVSYSHAKMKCDKPWIPPLARRTRIPGLQTAPFTFYGDASGGFESGIRVTQDTIRRMWQSFNTTAKVSGLNVQPSPRSSTLCYIQFTPTAAKSMLSWYHVSYMECVMKETEGETALACKPENYS